MTDALLLYNAPTLPDDHPDAESEHTVYDVAQTMADILRRHGWTARLYGMGQEPMDLLRELDRDRPKVVVNLFEGNPNNTETESYVAGLLEWKGIPFTGCPMSSLSMCRPKHLAKTLLKGAGLPTADFLVVEKAPVPECTIGFPVIVKLACQDASVGIDQTSVCTNQEQLESRIQYLLEHYSPPILVEQYIPGREINVALLELPELQTLPPSEILFPEEKPGQWGILTYLGKWDPDHKEYVSSPPKYPAELAPELAEHLCELSRKAYRLLGCRDYARVDFRLRGETPFILEVNPNPEISNTAGFAHALESAKIEYEDFILRLVEHARLRGKS